MSHHHARGDAMLTPVPLRSAVPSRGDGIAARATQVIGGPLGRYAVIGARGWRPAAAILSALSSMLVALGVLQKNHCVTAGWSTPGSLWRECYSDLPVAVSVPTGSHPWANTVTSGQPPLTALLTWFVRVLVPDGSQLRLQQGMFAWGAAVIALLIAIAVCLTASSLPRGPWAAAHIALSPVLVTVSLISFDALAVALVAAGFWAWRRGRFTTTGAFLAAAFLARPTLAVALLACVVVLLTRGRTRQAGAVALGAVVTIIVAGAVVWAFGASPFDPLTAWARQGASYGSLVYLLTFAGISLSPTELTTLAVLGWVVAVGVAVLAARTEKTLDAAPIALLMLAVVLATAKAVPVQAALWVLPFLALCAVRWRTHLIWAGVEFAYYVMVWTFVARASNPGKALPEGWYAAVTGARVVALFLLARAAIDTTLDDAAAEKRADRRRASSGAGEAKLRSQ